MASIANYLHFISKCIAEFHLSKEYVSNMCFFMCECSWDTSLRLQGHYVCCYVQIFGSAPASALLFHEKNSSVQFMATLKRFKTSSSQETFATHKTDMAKYKTFCFFFLSVISHQKSFTGIVNKLWWSRQLVHMGWYDEIIQIISVLPFICCFPQNIPNDSPRDASQLLMQSVACGKSKIIFVYQAKKHK